MKIEFRDVSVRREGRTILEGVSFATSGEGVFLLFGASGSGKTTLLRLVNRLDEPTEGAVLAGGRKVTEYDPLQLRRRVAMILQEPRLQKGTVGENILFPARCHGLEVDLEALLERVGLSGASRRGVESLSGGERQRVAVARALAVRPEVLLLDEPTSSLDETAAREVEELLLELAAGTGLHLLLVTHSRAQVRRLGSAGAVLEGGRAVHLGDVLQWEGARV